MNNWQRIFAYVSASLVLGLALIILTNSFLQYVSHEGTTGYLFLIGFGLVYLNINFGISRRFVMKAIRLDWICYLMAILTIAPTLFWVLTKDTGLGDTQLEFIIATVFSAFLGCYYGIRRGTVKREQYLRQLREENEDIPDSLRP
jgi:drug/metabolite transporter (DMT)-like permease